MKRFIGLVAVIGLTVTAVMGCAPSGESEPSSLQVDCGNAGEQWRGSDVSASSARIWPQMNDPDLKSIFRALAEPPVDDEDFLNSDLNFNYYEDPNWIAFISICPAGRDSCTESQWLDIPTICRFMESG